MSVKEGQKWKVRGGMSIREGGRVGEECGGGALLVPIRRNAELSDVSDSGGQTPRGAHRGHVCFSRCWLSH